MRGCVVTLSDLDFGDVPGWFGGIALALALLIFTLDRRDRARAFIDALGVWVDVEYTRRVPMSPEPVGTVRMRLHLRNSAAVPATVVQVGCDVHTWWVVQDRPRADANTEISSWTRTRGVGDPVRIFPEPGALGPGRGPLARPGVQRRPPATPDGASQLDIIGGAECRIAYALVVDNTGRRWRVRPGVKGRAQAVRWYHRQRGFEPETW
jgi:hypothetical protein